jgi:hypothetical protein
MLTAPALTRLAVGLVSVANASAAVSLPKPPAAATIGAQAVASAAQPRAAFSRLQRPPRVPRRERAGHEFADAAAAGGTA